MDRNWRTREDPFNDVWEAIRERLALNPGLEAKTLFATLQRDQPGRFADGQLRTLQRRVKIWRLTEGPAQEFFFAQRHEPGRLCASDFSHMTELGIMVGGRQFPSYDLPTSALLAYSGPGTCHDLLLGKLRESERGAAERTLGAGWRAGSCRTDSLSSAISSIDDLEEFTDRVTTGLLTHYGGLLQGERTQVGHAAMKAGISNSGITVSREIH